jgi:hypothetical protein
VVNTYDPQGRLIFTYGPSANPAYSQTTVDHRYLIPTSIDPNFGYSYELVSNPHCTTADPTMGWTRTKRGPNGRVREVANYTACPSDTPPPWGTCTTTSGGTKVNAAPYPRTASFIIVTYVLPS